MYRYSNGQMRLSDFQQPMGMQLREDNRWVKKAQLIPWSMIEEKYAGSFPSKTGNVAKPLQLAFGACLIQQEYGFSDEEIVLQIQENPYLQYFCGYSGYDDSKPPFEASSMVNFRKRLTPEIIAEINEMIIQEAQKNEADDDHNGSDDDHNGSCNSDQSKNMADEKQNSGTMIVDATCAPQNIKFPQDIELLNESREKLEKIIDKTSDENGFYRPRMYRKNARKDYLNLVKCKKRTAKKVRRSIKKQLQYLRRDFGYIDNLMQNNGVILSEKDARLLAVLRKVYEQQLYMFENNTHSVPDRIVSISQPFIRPIVRGKAKAPVEFGTKLDISVVDGWTRLEYHSFDAYNEAKNLPEMIEAFHNREGHYPERILADKIYRNRENLRYCKERGIRLSGPSLGRPKKDVISDRHQDYIDECERVEVERKFSLAKLKCGIGLVKAKLENTVGHVVAMSILLLNLRKVLCALLLFWMFGGIDGYCFEMLAVNQ